MKMTRMAAGVVLAAMAAGGALRGQDAPTATAPAGTKEIQLIWPSVNREAALVTLKGELWNEKQADWIEVAFCGRPSDFLHETLLSATTTRARLVEAMHQAGFRDGDAWVDNNADFPRLRGDRVLITAEVEKDGKEEIFALDEMIAFRGWGVSVGPYGWMFKGDAGRGAAATQAAPATGPGGGKISDAMRILTDDPQVALQFRGLQHVSRSFMDYPLAYDEWVMPDIDYVRNMFIEPKVLDLPKPDPKDAAPAETPAARHRRLLTQFWHSVYDSNGAPPVRIMLHKVNEEEYLTEAAKLWHDDAAAKNMLAQLDTARQIDKDKTEWLGLLPKVRKMAAAARIADPEKPIAQSAEFLRMAVLAAEIEKNYAALDAAWAAWAADHPNLDEDPTAQAELKAQTKAWKEHWQLNADHAAQELIVEQALAEATALGQKPDSPENRRALQKTNGVEIEARSRAMLAANKQALEVWQYRKDALQKDDPRVEMKQEILTNLALSQARAAAGEAGVAYGKALQAGDAAAITGPQQTYKKASLAMTIAGLEVQLADIDFEISKRDGMDDPDLPGMIKQRDAWRTELKAAKAAAGAQ